jgi:hypothetical protein
MNKMAFNKNWIGILVGLMTFIIVKVVFVKVGIENIPVPIIIALLAVSYTMFVLGVNKKVLTSKEKNYFIICASLLAIAFISMSVSIALTKYFSDNIMVQVSLLLIGMVAFVGSVIVAILVNKGRR